MTYSTIRWLSSRTLDKMFSVSLSATVAAPRIPVPDHLAEGLRNPVRGVNKFKDIVWSNNNGAIVKMMFSCVKEF
jgi:hypothetical protein